MNIFLHVLFERENQLVTGVAIAILCLAFFAYRWMYRAHARSALRDITRVTAALREGAKDWEKAEEAVEKVLVVSPKLRDSWIATRKRVVTLQLSDKTWTASFGSISDIWNAPNILSQRLNLALAEAAPGILVGVGLLCTFFFLSLALLQTTYALSASQSSEATQLAISELLRIAGAKFLTSLTGLLSSIVWTIMLRLSVKSIETACHELVDAWNETVSPAGGELLVVQQLELDRSHLEETKTEVGLTEELLLESREGTATLKRFETDWMVSLSGMLDKSLGGPMQGMTERLVGAVEALSERMGTMNQDALGQMMKDFTDHLSRATSSEMAQFKSTMEQLSANIDATGNVFATQAETLAQSLNQAGSQLVLHMQDAAQSLSNTITKLEAVSTSVHGGLTRFDSMVSSLTEIGESGSKKLSDAMEHAEDLLGQIEDVTRDFGEVSSSVSAAVSGAHALVDGIGSLAQEQKQVVTEVQRIAPTAMTAIREMTNLMDLATKQTHEGMRRTQESMESTAQSLSDTVSSITEGIGVYSAQVAQLHRSMDEQMAKAVGSLNNGVVELKNCIDDLIDAMPQAESSLS